MLLPLKGVLGPAESLELNSLFRSNATVKSSGSSVPSVTVTAELEGNLLWLLKNSLSLIFQVRC